MSKIYLEVFHFQARRDTAKNWNTSNPILCDGEFGIVTDSVDENWLKVGDGATPWELLPFKKGPKGNKGDKGDPFVYSDFTDEQLALLKGAKGDTGNTGPRGLQGEKGDTGATGATGAKGDKGDKGDAFTYEDFTAEQLAALKGAKGDKGEKGDKGDTGDVNTLQMNTACANALKGNATGQAVRLPDVSPNEHTLGVKVSSKNLWQNTNTTFPSALSYNSTNQTYILGAGTAGYNFVAHTLTNPIPVGTTVTISIMFQSGKGRGVAIGGYHRTGGKSWQGYISVPFDVDMTGQTLTSTFTTTETVEEFMVFHNTGDNIENPFIFKAQYELGTTATSYTPYISDLTSIIVTRYGTVETDSPQTYIPAADGTISGVKSLYPTTTLMTDTEEAIISAEYNRDINKAFAELQQAILSMGGNT